MELSLKTAVTLALEEINLKVFNIIDKDNKRMFTCLYDETLAIDITVGDTYIHILFSYLNLNNISDNADNLLKFFSMINGEYGFSGLHVNLNSLSGCNHVFSTYNYDSLLWHVKSKYYGEVITRFKNLLCNLTNAAILMGTFVSEIIDDKKEPEDVFMEALHRPLYVESFSKKFLK